MNQEATVISDSAEGLLSRASYRELPPWDAPEESFQPSGEVAHGQSEEYNSGDLERDLASMKLSLKPTSIHNTSTQPTAEDETHLRSCDRQFRMLRVLGRGGMGEVWEALQVDLGRVVAVKRARDTAKAKHDFLKEAYTAAQLDHPNIVPTYDIGIVDADGSPTPVIAMKKIEGRSWLQLINEDWNNRELTTDDFLARHLAIYVQVTNAVSFAHSKRIIHRDLKPEQVMVGEFGEVFLLDWGLGVYLHERFEPISPAKVLSSRMSTLQTASNPAGTPAYMAPEQARLGTDGLGIHTDIYLLGALLYELLTGKPPHKAETVRDALRLAAQNKFDPLPTSVPEELAELTLKCLSALPSHRPSSVAKIREVVQDYLTGAGKRQHSIRLVQGIDDRKSLSSYEELSACFQELNQAVALWPANPRITPVRERLLEAFVRVAIDRKDFILAQIQADRLRDQTVADEWRTRIDEAREKAATKLGVPPLFTPGRIGILLGAWLLIIGSVVWILYVAQNVVTREMHDKARSLASIIASEVRASDLRAVEEELQIYSPSFQKVLNQFNSYRRPNKEIRYIYTLVPRPERGAGQWMVLVDADPVDIDMDGDGVIVTDEMGNPPGNAYDSGIPEMDTAFREKRYTSGLLTDEWGTFISGFAPVIDPRTREAVAIVCIDIEIEHLQNRLRLVRTAAVSGLVVLLVFITFVYWGWFATRRSLVKIMLLEELVKKQNQEVRGKSISLG